MNTDPEWIRNRLSAPSQYQCGLTWDGSYLWHSDQDERTLFALDPRDGSVVKTLNSAWIRADLTHDGTHLVQVGGRPKRLVFLSKETGRKQHMQDVLPKSGRLTGIEYAAGQGYWMLFRDPTTIQLREPEHLDVVAEFLVAGDAPSGLTIAGESVIYGDYQSAELRALSTADGSLRGSIAFPGRPTGMTWDGQQLWCCDFTNNAIVAIDPAALGLAT